MSSAKTPSCKPTFPREAESTESAERRIPCACFGASFLRDVRHDHGSRAVVHVGSTLRTSGMILEMSSNCARRRAHRRGAARRSGPNLARDLGCAGSRAGRRGNWRVSIGTVRPSRSGSRPVDRTERRPDGPSRVSAKAITGTQAAARVRKGRERNDRARPGKHAVALLPPRCESPLRCAPIRLCARRPIAEGGSTAVASL
jgi:hypothetical protein